MTKRRLSIKKLFIVILGFIFIMYSIFSMGGIMISRIKYELIQSKKIVLNNDESRRYKIYIDPGHGGNDVGTISKSGKVYEKDIVLEISKKVVEELSNYSNVDVMVSRSEDKYVSLENRVKEANEANVDYFISIHVNSDPNSEDTHGVETYYSISNKKEISGSENFASYIQSNILEVIDAKDRGAKKSNFMVTKLTSMPAVLVECGFLSNNSEMNKLSTHMYQSDIAQGIVKGLVDYIEEK